MQRLILPANDMSWLVALLYTGDHKRIESNGRRIFFFRSLPLSLSLSFSLAFADVGNECVYVAQAMK